MEALNPDRAPRALGVARRAALVFALWLGFWLLAFALIGLLLAVPYAQARYDGGPGLGGLLALLAAVTLAIALFRPRGGARDARENVLAREEAPALYALAESIGARAGIRAPVAIRLVPGVVASIGAHRGWHGRLRGLDVSLGHGLLCVLDEAGVSAVIAHEYGHMAKGDLGLTPWVYRTRMALGATMGSLESSMFLLDVPFRLYAHAFLRQTGRISRAQEYAADALGAQQFGAAAMAVALRRVHAFAPEWDVYLDQVLTPALQHGARLPVLDGFRLFRASANRRPAVDEAIARGRAAPPHPADTHPSLSERLAALGHGDADAMPDAADPLAPNALSLLGGEAPADALWYRTFIRGTLQDSDWETYAERVLMPAVDARFAGTFLAPEQVALTELPTLLADPDALWRQIRPDGVTLLSAQGRVRHVCGVLEEFATASLWRRGWHARLAPGAPLWMERDGRRIVPERLIADVREGRVTADDLAAMASPAG